ncbi:MAG TPA: FecR domain-containing protein [Bryobacteraceae bacterium]|nr:FecR domain-containing protein [Bryobacteraceae bacterium]
MFPRRLYRTAHWLRWAAACICLVLAVVPLVPVRAESGAAKVITLNGQVSVLRDDSPWVLSVGDSIQPRQIVITGPDGYAVFQVSDGSTFEVFPNARVVFRENPGSWKDLLDILLGRVKVHIQKLGGQPNYNRVRTPTAVISVRGTIFDVAIEDEDDTTLVSVEEGQVGVQHLLKPGPERILNQGESIRVYRDQPLAAAPVDKNGAIRALLQRAEQVLYEIVYRTPMPGSVPGNGCPIPSACTPDKKNPPPPPTVPPPPAPAPPH